jgi:hypothetical protein
MNKMTVSIHPIATRTKHNYDPVELVEWVIEHHHLDWTKGDKEGIFHCKIPVEWVKGQIMTLVENESYDAKVTFAPRKGVVEDPRQETKVVGVPDKVDDADVIIYSHELLGKDASSDSDFEIIAIRGLTSVPNPRPLNTLLCNIFGMSGGTEVEGTAEQKLEMIRESFLFWKNKVMVS